ncbi:MAG: metal ABC transporter permease [Lachnospiraceae bacterium]
MSGIITELQYYFSYPFVRYALVVGVLVALCSSLFGVSLVLKRFSFIGDGLSHVAFGAMAFATMFKLANTTVLVMPLTVLAAIFLLRTGQNTRIKGDSAIAMLSVGALAVGYLIMNVFSVSANVSGDVCSTLFGSTTILTLTGAEVTICIVMSVIVVAFFVLFYNRIFAVTFDETFLRATGKKAELYNLMIAVITAVIIVLAMNLVGSLLITALLIFPALSAMRVMYSFRGVVIYAAVLSVLGAFAGMILSILFSTPVGATIVVMDILIYLINCLAGRILRH